MTDNAIKARRAYKRDYMKKWNAKNKDKLREYQERYWEKKGREMFGEKNNHE